MAEEFVSSKIRCDKVTVFGKPSCPYCHMAVELLEKLGVKHLEYVDLTTRADMSNIQDYMLRTTGARSVPRVFIGETCIGGYDNLKALHDRGELIPKLKEIGAL
ncbi:PREDICTED: glutaredoxin-1 [Gekko japonicus]|uniref:Glutaredoxin-1 n=1 Tax=Gekko japonicus TaxID=146911 RepID=A0ABM1LCJ5_GEKJA|nr:PREDICTED: glutaredoxin-1 [Gekko japonicus]